jgi:WD40 repeat protein
MEGPAVVWDSATGKELLTLKGHTGPVMSVAFSRDGGRIVTGSWDATVRVWDAETGKSLLTLKDPTSMNGAGTVAFSPDGRRILAGSGDADRVWFSNAADAARAFQSP